MRTTFLVLLTFIWTQNIFAGNPPKIVQEHLFRVLRLSDWKLNPVQKKVRSLIKALDTGHKLTPNMLNYFAIYPSRLLALRSAAKTAEKQSKKICGVIDEPRHENDEVDALRHFILSAILTKNLGPEAANEILSLQEDRKNIKVYDTYMDLLNNEIGVDYMKHAKKRTTLHQIITKGQELLTRGELNVLESKTSLCQEEELYPNLLEKIGP